MALNREDIDGLKELDEKTSEYIQLLFDWVSPLRQHALLDALLEKLYGLQFEIEQAIEKIEGADNGD
jgi:hypothetical protein